MRKEALPCEKACAVEFLATALSPTRANGPPEERARGRTLARSHPTGNKCPGVSARGASTPPPRDPHLCHCCPHPRGLYPSTHAHPSDPAPEKSWRVITGPSGSRTRPAARLNLPPPLTGPRIKPTGGSGCEDAQLAGLSCHPARHDGVWTGPVHTPPAPSGLPTAVVCGHRRGGEDRGRPHHHPEVRVGVGSVLGLGWDVRVRSKGREARATAHRA